MPVLKRNNNFYESEEGVRAKRTLQDMVTDDSFNTSPIYSSKTEIYKDNLMPFVEKHMDYLCNHPAMDPRHYLSNLRLMTRKKIKKTT